MPAAQVEPGTAFIAQRLMVQVLPTLLGFSGVARSVQVDAAFGQAAAELQGVSHTPLG